ncbi:hypothetical protein JOD82_004371 [Paenibacillus sp. 1182]|nr:hypothetical protein [Paenibacillus sp. 1182]
MATFVERKTRLYTTIQMPDRTALSMEIAFGIAASPYPTAAFQTVTADRGKEFACYSNLEATHDVQIYFADPYPSWQRDSNENANGIATSSFTHNCLANMICWRILLLYKSSIHTSRKTSFPYTCIAKGIKYTETAGHMNIKVMRTIFCRIDITDNGIGIVEEEYGKIFTRYYRSHTANS